MGCRRVSLAPSSMMCTCQLIKYNIFGTSKCSLVFLDFNHDMMNINEFTSDG